MARLKLPTGDPVNVGHEIALALGLLANIPFLFFVLYASAELLPELSLSTAQGLPLLMALALALVGVIIALRWKLAGGTITAICAIAITTLVNLGSGHGLLLLALLNSLPYALISLFLLFGNPQTRRRRFRQVMAMGALVYIGSGRALLLLATLNSIPLFVAGILFLACSRRIGRPRISLPLPKPYGRTWFKAQARRERILRQGCTNSPYSWRGSNETGRVGG